MKATLTLFLLFLGALTLQAQPGSLDPGFSGDGILRFNLGVTGSYGACSALQPDGKILIGGPAFRPPNDDNDFGIARLNEDGTLDSTFHGNGKLRLDLGSTYDWVSEIVVQPDGKIIAAGRSELNSISDITCAIVRINSDGSMDPDFGNAGTLKPSIPGLKGAVDMVLQPDGKIVVGSSLGSETLTIARFLPNGDVDTGFGTGGILFHKIPGFDTYPTSMAIQGDGKILVFGTYMPNANESFFLVARYLPTGIVDTSFNHSGFKLGKYGSFGSGGIGMTVAPDQKIVVCGTYGSGIGLARINPDGSFDNTFGQNGSIALPFPSMHTHVNDVQIQSDGKIVCVGGFFQVQPVAQSGFLSVRFTTDGALDQSFGIAGVTITTIPANVTDLYDQAHTVKIQPDGKIVVVGTAYFEVGVVRFLNDLNVGIADLPNARTGITVYPNPIASSATLRYELSEQRVVTIQLFDLQGNMVKTFLSDQIQDCGIHDMQMDMPEGLATGTYVLVLDTGKSRTSVQLFKQ